jgi:hypothetical protein
LDITLFTGNECNVCKEAEDKFKEKYAKEIETGEATIVNLDDPENEQAQKFWMKHELPYAPIIVIVTESEKLVTVLDVETHLNMPGAKAPELPEDAEQPIEEATTAAADAISQPV